MQEAASRVLQERSRHDDRIGRMFSVSLVLHVLLIVLLVFSEGWRPGRHADPAAEPMFISLGGAPGPQTGGMTPMGGRPIQQAVPMPESPRPEPIRPPAARAPEMTVPQPAARPRQPTRPAARAPEDARGRTPTRGPEERAGSTVAETGGRGVGFGLTTGGGGGTGSYLDVGDFCCPEYISTMLQIIRQHWDSKQQVPGETMMKFTIQRDGSITGVEVERSSGYFALDQSARRALLVTRLPPLPAAFTEPQLTVHLNFQYQR